MFTPEDEKELERQADEASVVLLLLLFTGRRNVRSARTVKFDRKRGVFLVDGRRVSVTTMRVLLAQIEKIGDLRIRKHVDDLVSGRITLEQWRERMGSTLRVGHWLSAALALGGLDAARNDNTLAARINSELAYLDGFYEDIRANRVSDPKKRSRALLYLLAFGITYGAIEQALKSGLIKIERPKGGKRRLTPPIPEPTYKEARRYRRAAESCGDCVRYSGFWMPIKKMPAIGSLECRSRCRCFIVYR